MVKGITVQQLIDKLMQVEDKSAIIVTADYEYGIYYPVDDICVTKIHESFDVSKSMEEDANTVSCVII